MGVARTRTRGERGGRARAGQAGGGGSEHGGRPRPPALAPHPRPSPRHATRLPTHRPRAADDAAPSPDSPVDPDHRGLGARSAARPQPGGGKRAAAGGAAASRGPPPGHASPGRGPARDSASARAAPTGRRPGSPAGTEGWVRTPDARWRPGRRGEPGRDNRGRRRGHGGKTDGVPDPGPSNPDRPRPARHGTANPPPTHNPGDPKTACGARDLPQRDRGGHGPQRELSSLPFSRAAPPPAPAPAPLLPHLPTSHTRHRRAGPAGRGGGGEAGSGDRARGGGGHRVCT